MAIPLNYYAPLTYYLSFALHWEGLKRLLWVEVDADPGAGAWSSRHISVGTALRSPGWGPSGAIVLQLLSVRSVGQLLEVRGAVAESVALLSPWALWAWRSCGDVENVHSFPPCWPTSAVFLSHNLTGLSCALLAGLRLARCALAHVDT